MIDEPLDVFLRRLGAAFGPLAGIVVDGLGRFLTEGIVPILAGAAAFLQNLQERCPEAFDDAGNLRPDWQEIVTAKLESMTPKTAAPMFHGELATRNVQVWVN